MHDQKYRDRQAGAFRILTIWETKTARPARALANNLSADIADNRFHGAFYGAGMTFGQEGRRRKGGNWSDLSGCATSAEPRLPFSWRKSRIASSEAAEILEE
ncbi:hypothetical protein [Rhizobium aegyptiacum]|uniref:hypothetical protein n=1 Tax=Rhizobium aegyptiacum TaxID=1764550 RepID=UPI0012E9508B|nr:hypothetical protein [Rhizobium aegyptiacum]